MGVSKINPHNQLQHSIDSYFIYNLNNPEPVIETYFPTGKTGIVFHFADRVCFKNRNGEWIKMAKINFVSCVNFPVQLKLEKQTRTIAVVLKPYAIYNIFKMKIVDDTEAVDATAFFPDELYISLISSDDEQAQSVILDNWFLEKFRNYKPDKDSFKQICDTIIHQKGMITRSQLALQFNLSENYMHKLFVKKIGLSVKPFAQLVRISSILEDIYRGNHTGSIDILVKYGYYDQAHFIKDFKRITHQTPHQYFRNDTTLSALLAGIK